MSRTIRVSPGDKIESYVVYNGVADNRLDSYFARAWLTLTKKGSPCNPVRIRPNSYTMYIAANGQSVTTTYKLLKQQHLNESTAYFVLEHQPSTCRAYPTDGVCTFSNIAVAVDYQTVVRGDCG